jgi:hypothetical protein
MDDETNDQIISFIYSTNDIFLFYNESNTSLTSSHFSEVPVPSEESERLYIYVYKRGFCYFYDFLLDLRSVPIV